MSGETLICNNCSSTIFGDKHSIETAYCSTCPDKDKIQELVMMITTDYWGLFPKNDQVIIEQRLQQLGL